MPSVQVCRPICHATAAAARTESAPLARERDQAIVTAGREVSKLLFDEARQALAVAHGGGLRAERLEMIAHQLVQRTLLGLARSIAGGRGGHAGKRRKPRTRRLNAVASTRYQTARSYRSQK